jgi:ATP synthase protein I
MEGPGQKQHGPPGFGRTVGDKERRRLKARTEKNHVLWLGFGMIGLVGWSVAVPTLLFTALGIWIDARVRSGYSWTLMLMLIGLVLGCVNAWYWVSRARKE